MDLEAYRKLEMRLVAAEDVFFDSHVYTAKAMAFRAELHDLRVKVTVERINAEVSTLLADSVLPNPKPPQ